MPATAARKKRSQRFNVRASDREARLIRLGAERRGVNITSFILESACVRAEQEIADTRKTNTGLMATIAKGLSDDEVRAAAEYFGGLKMTDRFKDYNMGGVKDNVTEIYAELKK